jgi:hypothetical protein
MYKLENLEKKFRKPSIFNSSRENRKLQPNSRKYVPASYLGGPAFRSPTAGWLSWLEFIEFFLIPYRQMPKLLLKLGKYHFFLLLLSLLFINFPVIRRHII